MPPSEVSKRGKKSAQMEYPNSYRYEKYSCAGFEKGIFCQRVSSSTVNSLSGAGCIIYAINADGEYLFLFFEIKS